MTIRMIRSLCVLLVSLCATILQANDINDVKIDLTTRHLSVVDGTLSAEVKVAWYGTHAPTSQNYRLQFIDSAGNVLAQKPLSVNANTVNRALAQYGEYRTDWLAIKASDVKGGVDALFVSVVGETASQRTRDGAQINSPLVRQALSLSKLPYAVQNVRIDQARIRGNTPVTIQAQVIDPQTKAAVPFVRVNVVISHRQYDTPIIVNSDASGNVEFVYRAAQTGEHRISVVHPDDRNRPEQARFFVEKPVTSTARAASYADLQFKQSLVKTGLRFNTRVTEKVLIENVGTATARNAKVRITAKNATHQWVRIVSQDETPSLENGKNWEVHVEFAPPKTFKTEGVYDFTLTLEYGDAPNVVKRTLPIKATVTNNQLGDYVFKVEDIYTNFKGTGGNQGVANARITLTKDNVRTSLKTAKTNATGEVTFKDLPSGFYTYQASADKHTSKSGEVYVRAGVSSRHKVFLDIPVVKVSWSVTETTIEDKYDIVVDATYETDVPQPVLVIEPPVVKLPAMQAGDVIKGAFRITNDGLISVRNLKASLPKSDKYIQYDFSEEAIPEKLLPQQTVYLPYTLKATRALKLDLSDVRSSGLIARQTKPNPLLAATNRATCSRTFGYQASGSLNGDFTCPNGDKSSSSSGVRFVHAGETQSYSCGSGTGGNGWYWWGCIGCYGGTGSAGECIPCGGSGTPPPQGMSPCSPNLPCDECCGGGGGPGPGPSPGPSPGGGGGAPPISPARPGASPAMAY